MKIDTHQHYWHYAAEEFAWIDARMPALQQDCLPDTVAPALQAAGVDAVVAVQARSCAAETGFLLGLAERHPHIVGVVGWTDLCAPDVADALDRHAGHPLLKGMRHILQDDPQLGAFMRQSAFHRGVQALQQRGLVYDVLVFDHQLPDVLAFCAQHHAHWLVLDHVAKPCLRDWAQRPELSAHWLAGLRALAAMPHVVCKLSGLVTEADWAGGLAQLPATSAAVLECFDRALELFGPQRLLYGSDWPVCALAAPYAHVHGLAQQWASTRLSAPEQADFWSGNAQRCYRLQTPSASA